MACFGVVAAVAHLARHLPQKFPEQQIVAQSRGGSHDQVHSGDGIFGTNTMCQKNQSLRFVGQLLQRAGGELGDGGILRVCKGRGYVKIY